MITRPSWRPAEVRVTCLTIYAPAIAFLEWKMGKRESPVATPTLIETRRFRWKWRAQVYAFFVNTTPSLGASLMATVEPCSPPE